MVKDALEFIAGRLPFWDDDHTYNLSDEASPADRAKTFNKLAEFCAAPSTSSLLVSTGTAIVSILYHKSKKFLDRNMQIVKAVFKSCAQRWRG